MRQVGHETFACPAGVATTIGGEAEKLGSATAPAVGQAKVCEGHVPVTVQPLLDVGAGAAVPVPPFAIDSGKEGPEVAVPGQLTTSDGNVPTVHPLVPVGAGAAVPVPPLAILSGRAGPAEAVGQTGT